MGWGEEPLRRGSPRSLCVPSCLSSHIPPPCSLPIPGGEGPGSRGAAPSPHPAWCLSAQGLRTLPDPGWPPGASLRPVPGLSSKGAAR